MARVIGRSGSSDLRGSIVGCFNGLVVRFVVVFFFLLFFVVVYCCDGSS